MAKEFNADTATPAEGIVATFEFEIENAGDDEKQKKNIALNIGDAVEKKYITQEQAEKLYKKLGVPAPAPTKKTKEHTQAEAQDRELWECDIHLRHEALEKAKGYVEQLEDKVKQLKLELKNARQELAKIQEDLNENVGQGSRNFKARNRTLFDGLEDGNA